MIKLFIQLWNSTNRPSISLLFHSNYSVLLLETGTSAIGCLLLVDIHKSFFFYCSTDITTTNFLVWALVLILIAKFLTWVYISVMKKYQNVRVFYEYMNVQISESVHIFFIFYDKHRNTAVCCWNKSMDLYDEKYFYIATMAHMCLLTMLCNRRLACFPKIGFYRQSHKSLISWLRYLILWNGREKFNAIWATN